METFHGFNFDTMTPTADDETDHARSTDADGDVSFLRGVIFGLAFSIPGWLLIAGTFVAVLG